MQACSINAVASSMYACRLLLCRVCIDPGKARELKVTFSRPGKWKILESRVPPGHGKSWNLGRPFFQAWKVMENSKGHRNWKVMDYDDNVMEFLLPH